MDIRFSANKFDMMVKTLQGFAQAVSKLSKTLICFQKYVWDTSVELAFCILHSHEVFLVCQKNVVLYLIFSMFTFSFFSYGSARSVLGYRLLPCK